MSLALSLLTFSALSFTQLERKPKIFCLCLGVFQFFTGNISPTKPSVDVGWGNLDQNLTEMETMFKTPEKDDNLVYFSFMESLY